MDCANPWIAQIRALRTTYILHNLTYWMIRICEVLDDKDLWGVLLPISISSFPVCLFPSLLCFCLQSMYEPFLKAQLDHSESFTSGDEEDVLDMASVPQWTPNKGQEMLAALMEACLSLPSDGREWQASNVHGNYPCDLPLDTGVLVAHMKRDQLHWLVNVLIIHFLVV